MPNSAKSTSHGAHTYLETYSCSPTSCSSPVYCLSDSPAVLQGLPSERAHPLMAFPHGNTFLIIHVLSFLHLSFTSSLPPLCICMCVHACVCVCACVCMCVGWCDVWCLPPSLSSLYTETESLSCAQDLPIWLFWTPSLLLGSLSSSPQALRLLCLSSIFMDARDTNSSPQTCTTRALSTTHPSSPLTSQFLVQMPWEKKLLHCNMKFTKYLLNIWMDG